MFPQIIKNINYMKTHYGHFLFFYSESFQQII